METAVTVALISLAGVLVSILFNHRLSVWRDHRPIAREFAALIALEIDALEAGKRPINETFDSAFRKQVEAAAKFRNSLSERKRKVFDQAWDSYANMTALRSFVQPAGSLEYQNVDRVEQCLRRLYEFT